MQARIKFATTVTQEDVDEAVRLIDSSKASIVQANDKKRANRGGAIAKKFHDTNTKIYSLLKELAKENSSNGCDGEIELDQAYQRLKLADSTFKEEQLQRFIEEFSKCNLLKVLPMEKKLVLF